MASPPRRAPRRLVACHFPSSRAPCSASSCALPSRRASYTPVARKCHASAAAHAFCLPTSHACTRALFAHDLPAAITLPTAHFLLSTAALPSPPFAGILPSLCGALNPSSPLPPPSPASFAPPPPSPLITSASYTPSPLFSPPYPSCSSSLPPPPSSPPLLQLADVVACHLVIVLLSPHIPLLHPPPPLTSLPPLPLTFSPLPPPLFSPYLLQLVSDSADYLAPIPPLMSPHICFVDIPSP
ncbi:unnamed protein product [Closterium sp. NIES-64]|nr:unnamed protein product [Closterium sp. NIES-64]